MKLNMKKINLNSFLIIFLVIAPLFVNAQINRLSKSDKAQIITIILKEQKFRDSKYPNTDKRVYILMDNISFNLLPKIKDIEFVSITQNQIDEMKKTGVEYYSFGEFKVNGKNIEVSFSRTYINVTGKYSNGYSMVYESRKVSGRWKVRGGKPAVWIGESK